VNVLQDLSFAFTSQGHLDQAAGCLSEALNVARRLGALSQLAGILNNLANVYYCRGEYDKALPLYEEGLLAARRGDDPRWEANILIGIADLYRDIQAYDEAERYYGAAWKMVNERKPGVAFYILVAQADMARWRRDLTACEGFLTQAQALAVEKSLQTEMQGLLKVSRGAFLIENDNPEGGRVLLAEAIDYLQHTQVLSDIAKARFLLARAHLLASDPDIAEVELRRALDITCQLETNQFVYSEGPYIVDLLEFGVKAGLSECEGILGAIRAHRDKHAGLLPRDSTPEVKALPLEVFAFGEGRVVRDGTAVKSSEWRAATAKELFFYVLLNGPITRDAIGLEFWPDLSPKSMRDTFHSTMYRVRQAVGHDIVVLIDGEYQVTPQTYWFDVEEFDHIVERARLLPPHDWQTEELWRRAVELYTGDFLPEMDRLWTMTLRERYREMHLEALIGLGRCSEARNNYLEAITRYQQALEEDNLREELYGRIMKCFIAAGRRSDAISQYRRYRLVFMEELGVEPSPEISAIYKRIAGNTPS
jgi:DNA-binding SARP family transcriptional activator